MSFPDISQFRNQKNKSERDRLCGALIGDKAQGKTSLLILFALTYAQNNPGHRVLIHDPSKAFGPKRNLFDQPFEGFPIISTKHLRLSQNYPNTELSRQIWKKPICRILDTEEDETVLNAIQTHFRGGLVILDEATTWMADNPPKWQRNLITKHRNSALDVIYVFHQLFRIPKRLRGDFWAYFFFKIPDKIVSAEQLAKAGFPNPEQLYETYLQAQQCRYNPQAIIQELKGFQRDFNQF